MTNRMHVWSRLVNSGVYQDASSTDRLASVTSNDSAIVVIDQDHIGSLEHAEVHLLLD